MKNDKEVNTNQVDAIVSSKDQLDDLKRATLMLQRVYGGIEPEQTWGGGRKVNYKPLITESINIVNELRSKYKF